MWRRPLLEVRLVKTGKNILPQLKGYWTEVSVEEKDGGESDTAEIVCIFRSTLQLPTKGTEYEIYMGWADEGLVLQGRFSVQKFSRKGDPESGHFLVIHLRAADFIDKLKAEGSESYDNPDMTFGELMADLGKKTGVETQVDPELAKKKVGYRFRYQQSPIDFANEVGEELGATVKPAGGKLIATQSGGGKSASGKELDRIKIVYNRSWGYEIETEPRPDVGNVAAAWQDPKTGRRKMVKEKTGREGPIQILDHPYQSEADAKEAAKAAAYEAGNATGTGTFETYGRPKARAGAFVNASRYGAAVDGEWKADSIKKTVTADDGFLTTVTVSAGKDAKDGKSGKGKGGDGPRANDGELPGGNAK